MTGSTPGTTDGRKVRLRQSLVPFDADKNGIGFACDDAERDFYQNRVQAVYSGRFVPAQPMNLPVPGPSCPQCNVPYLPNGYEDIINLDVPADFIVRAVDAQGRTVSKGKQKPFGQTLKFQPVSYFKANSAPAGFAPESVPAGVAVTPRILAPDQTRYWIQVYSPPGADLSKTYTFTVSVAQMLPGTLYLPLLRR